MLTGHDASLLQLAHTAYLAGASLTRALSNASQVANCSTEEERELNVSGRYGYLADRDALLLPPVAALALQRTERGAAEGRVALGHYGIGDESCGKWTTVAVSSSRDQSYGPSWPCPSRATSPIIQTIMLAHPGSRPSHATSSSTTQTTLL